MRLYFNIYLDNNLFTWYEREIDPTLEHTTLLKELTEIQSDIYTLLEEKLYTEITTRTGIPPIHPRYSIEITPNGNPENEGLE